VCPPAHNVRLTPAGACHRQVKAGKKATKKGVSDYTGLQLIHFIFERALKKFRWVSVCMSVCVRMPSCARVS
jgi:hypothetical protein